MNTTSPFTREEVVQIARSQKGIIALIVVNLLVGLSFALPMALLGPDSRAAVVVFWLQQVAGLIVTIIAVILIFRLAKALRKTAWAYALAALIPCISLIALLMINHYATQTLRQNGVRVGIWGARKSGLENLPPTLAPPPPS